MTKCFNCGAPAALIDGRCAACGSVRPDPSEGATFLGDSPLLPASVGPFAIASDATQWPPDYVTGRGAYAEAPTDSGLPSGEELTGVGLPRAPASTTVPTTAVPPIKPSAPIDPEATMMGGPDPDVTRYGMPSDATRLPDLDRTRTGMPEGLVVQTADGPGGPLQPGTPFGPRYHIVQLLGLGGMGAVYKAWDAELGVLVAVKVIRPEIAADPRAAAMLERRFKQELLLARQVTHKNVVRIHELGEIDGIKFLTMPFIEGEELASILQRHEKLPIERLMKIARGIATGLEAAHAAGVVHRDLKPPNIMVDKDDEPLIMDFGIARSTGGPQGAQEVNIRTKGPASGNQTMVGAVVGTVQYMAPEQARAQPVDQRADIYAFGLIVYDMLLNKQRAKGSQTAIEELQARMQAAPPAPRTIDPTIPEPLNQLVATCIEPDATRRFQTTPDLVAALNRLDDKGKLLPVTKRLTKPMMAAMAAGVVALLGVTYYAARGPEIPAEHEPVAVLIADFQNQTGDPQFDLALEPVVKLGLEGAGFITAIDRSAVSRTLGVRPPEVMDEKAAIELAVKQGVGVVLSGTLTKEGDRFGVKVKASEPVSGKVIAENGKTAPSKDAVLGVVAGLADGMREALGDDKSDTAQRFAMETLSATSLDVVRSYATAMEAMSRSQFTEALQAFGEAVKLDANFGLAYGGMAMASNNLGRQQEAEKYIKEAMSRVDSMTERERYRTRGLYYVITNDYQACVKEYGDLIAKYSADAAARNNRALCLSKLRDMSTAVEEMRQVVKILPNRALYRVNLATYAAYGGDAATAEQEARKVVGQSPWAPQPLAFAQMLNGQLAEAAQSYEEMAKPNQAGPSYTASGLADVAMYEGRFSDAVRILTDGVAEDLAAKEPDRAANKLAAIAYVEVFRGRKPAAIAAAEKALAHSQIKTIQFLSARALVEAGAPEKAKAIAKQLGLDLQAESQAYASIIDGMVALAEDDVRNAVRFLTDANEQLDTWIGHFELGRAYLAGNAFPQADSEFDRCIKRRGEVLALFLDEEPTFGLFPPVYYYQGKVREGLKTAGYAESYKGYLAIRGKSTEDPLVAQLRKKTAG